MAKSVFDWTKLYNSSNFQLLEPVDVADLGVFCSDQKGTRVKIWAPVASRVQLNIYKESNRHRAIETYPLTRLEKGLWQFATNENWHGKYYNFSITIDGQTANTIDPYARSANANARLAMMVDFEKVNPSGWNDDKAPIKTDDTLIYELHIKEFSSDPAGGWTEDNRGKYSALATPSHLIDHPEISTGLDHIAQLGVTHIQLMPIYDFASIDESIDTNKFNWGYDPQNYNLPEGSYSSDPSDGATRIRELKQAIMAIHKKGLRVIMDVVYNHTWNLSTSLQDTAPYYFYRTTNGGYLWNGSGCGNDIASERPMVEKFIIDSILFWAREYHIDGFRFDLMGLLTVELMNKIQNSLNNEFGEGEKLLYGEPWTAATTGPANNMPLANKDNMGLLNERIGMFSDDIRDAIKGSASNLASAGFVNGAKHLEMDIVRAATAWLDNTTSHHLWIKNPGQIINYISAHDNQTLYDKLATIESDPTTIMEQYRLALGINFMSQGRIFMLSGTEFARTKNGEENSYNAPIEINQLAWFGVWEHRDLVSYVSGLAHLRKQLPALTDLSPDAYQRLTESTTDDGIVILQFNNESTASKSPYQTIMIGYNRNRTAYQLNLPAGEWALLATGHDSWLWRDPETISDHITIDPINMIVLGQKSR